MHKVLQHASIQGVLPASADPVAASLKQCRILIVDDSAVMRTIIAAYLRRDGYQKLDFAANGNEALNAAKQAVPDLVITDLSMPAMDGFELCRRLRAEPMTAHVPILVQTGSEQPDDRKRSFASGASDFITKPIDGNELIARTRVHLDRRILISHLTEYQRRMDEELALAKVMQESLLPGAAEIAHLSARLPLSIASSYEASIGLGGDIWGLTSLGHDRLRVYSADFTGHGVGSALNTFRLHSFIGSNSTADDDPGRWLSQLNAFLCSALQCGQFATMFAGIIDFSNNSLCYAAAGAPSPLIRFGTKGRFDLLDGSGIPLGITRDATYDTQHLPFVPGSMLVLYSDALIETPLPPNTVFTPETLCTFLDSLDVGTTARTANAVNTALLAKLAEESNESPADDLTLITLQYRCKESWS